MTIEAALAELTAAVKENTAALLKSGKSAGKKAAAEPETSASPQTPAQQPAAAPPAASTVTTKQFTEAFVKLAEIVVGGQPVGHTAALQILKDFKVERASLVPADKLPDALKAVEAAVAQVSKPPAASSLI